MKIKEVILQPTATTLNKLEQLFETCPFTLDWQELYLSINIYPDLEKEPVVDPDIVFLCKPGFPSGYEDTFGRKSLVTMYNASTQSTALYLALNCPALTRYAELLQLQCGTFIRGTPLLYVNLCRFYHNSLRHNRFVNSVSDALLVNKPALAFSNMQCRTVDMEDTDVSLYDALNMM